MVKHKRYAVYMFIIAVVMLFCGLSQIGNSRSFAVSIGFILFAVPFLLMGISLLFPRPQGTKWISSHLNKAALILFVLFILYVILSNILGNSQKNESQSNNPFMNAKTEIVEMDNGFDWKGTRAYIVIDKKMAQNATEEEFGYFIKTCIDGKKYNWFTVDFGDGTGICFIGGIWYNAQYGTIDSDGTVIDPHGYFTVIDEDKFTLEYHSFDE